MAASESCLSKQAKRLLALPFAPHDPEDIRSLLEDFKRILRPRTLTDGHCAAVVDYLIDHSQRCPPPAEIIAAVDTVEAPDEAKAPMGCQDCKGSGFRRFTRRVKVNNGQHEYDADFADFCTCRLGEFKRAGEQRYKAEQAAKRR